MLHMTRFRGGLAALAVAGAVGMGWSVLRAADGAPAATATIAELMQRIEKLEKRLAVLEERDSLPRQASVELIPAEPPRLAEPPKGPESRPGERPAVRFWLLKQSSQK